jgi:membrane fusion protein (multidrug efflux system)
MENPDMEVGTESLHSRAARSAARLARPAPALLVTLALTLSACGAHGGPGGPPGAQGPGGGPPPAELGFVVVQPRDVSLTTELPGRTVPYRIAEVRPQVNGIVRERRFTEGSDVRRGEALYQIDSAPYRANAASAQAQLAKAQANVESLRLKVGRYRELVDIQAVSRQDYDDAVASLAQAQADVGIARAALDTSHIDLDYTRVTAPISGRIGKSSVTAGALVTANQATPLATVQQLDPIYVDVTQSSAAVLRLRHALEDGTLRGGGPLHAKVALLLEDGSHYPLEGELQFSDVTVDEGTGTITLRAVFPNPKGTLLPGMYVRAVVNAGTKPQALLAPQSAVSRDAQGRATAFVVGKGDQLEPRILQADRIVDGQWLVTEGLAAGDRLVVEGQQKLRPGMPFKAVPAGEGAAPQGQAARVASLGAPSAAASPATAPN